ncbi:MAG: hypothetical protein M0P31_09280 [Solirubrobacteraceae bacterium]|nr:hypothetical protein [Solirubrobacteraceae bacterium]
MRSITLSRPALRSSSLAALAAGALAVAGCGGDDEKTTTVQAPPAAGGAVTSVLAGDVPASAIAFGEFNIRPSGDNKAAIDQITGFFGLSDVGKALRDGMDLDDLDNLVAKGKSFEGDVLPLIGDKLGVFLLPEDQRSSATDDGSDDDTPVFSLVGAVKDAAALREVLKPEKSKAVDVDGQQILVETEDDGDDTGAIWIKDDRFFLGTEPAVRAAVAADKGGDLGADQRFSVPLQQLKGAEPVGLGWVDLKGISTLEKLTDDGPTIRGLTGSTRLPGASRLKSMGSKSGPLSALGSLPEVDGSAAFALDAKPGVVRLTTGGRVAKGADGTSFVQGLGKGAALVGDLPAGSWIAAGTSREELLAGIDADAIDVDAKQVTDMLRRETGITLPPAAVDQLINAQSIALSGRGDSLVGIGANLIVQAADADGAGVLLDAIKTAAEGVGLRTADAKLEGADRAIQAQAPQLPLPLAAAIKGDRVIVGVGTDSVTNALSGKDRLKDDAGYKEAQAALGLDPSVFIDARPLSSLLGSLPAGAIDDLDDAQQVLGRLKLIAGGMKATGDETFAGSVVVHYDEQARPVGGGAGAGTTTDPGLVPTPGR